MEQGTRPGWIAMADRGSSRSGAPDQGLRPRERLARANDFLRARRGGASKADANLIVYVCRNQLSYSRIGPAVGRRVGSAVERNRIKRLIREAFRLSKAELPIGYDLLVVARPEVKYTFAAVRDSLVELARKAAGKLERRD
jgi:ribonuclease P protein component